MTNSRKLKRIIIPAVVVGALATGGVAAATTLHRDDLDGPTLDRASESALAAVGEGRVTGAETGDDGLAGYEVEVTRPDGREVDVLLDRDFRVVSQEDEQEDAQEDARVDDTDGDDDRALDAGEREKAAAAARADVPGTVLDVEAGDDVVGSTQVAYEVEVRGADGRETVVRLDRDFAVLDSGLDD